jgi:hypothetical protein
MPTLAERDRMKERKWDRRKWTGRDRIIDVQAPNRPAQGALQPFDLLRLYAI